jgi:membrane-associated phospholipid phosphatase
MTPPRLVQHVRGMWPGAGIWLPLPFVAWPLGCIVTGHGRWEHVAMAVVVPLLAYASPSSKRMFVGLLPIGLLGLVYDAMRWVKDVGVTPDRVHVCDLRAIDMRIASATVGGERVSVHDWVQAHTSPALDILFAVPYGTFLLVAIGFAIFLYRRDYARMRLFAWGFLAVNLAGFATYHLYPAAAPWYFHLHGCTVDLAARANEGANLARVDDFLGVRYFHAFYGRSSDVFGAVPSLHAAYPVLILLFGWPAMRLPGRAFAILFFVSMCTAAVYLDHHWIIDVVLGIVYTVAVFAGVMMVTRSRAAPREGAEEPAPVAPEASP